MIQLAAGNSAAATLSGGGSASQYQLWDAASSQWVGADQDVTLQNAEGAEIGTVRLGDIDSGAYQFTASADVSGLGSLRYRVVDGHTGASAEAAVTVSVGGSGAGIEASGDFGSGYLTGNVAGDRQRWTFSAWVKGDPGESGNILSAGGSRYSDGLGFNGQGGLRLWLDGAIDGYVQTGSWLTDASRWYHVVVSVDTTQRLTGSGSMWMASRSRRRAAVSIRNRVTRRPSGRVQRWPWGPCCGVVRKAAVMMHAMTMAASLRMYIWSPARRWGRMPLADCRGRSGRLWMPAGSTMARAASISTSLTAVHRGQMPPEPATA